MKRHILLNFRHAESCNSFAFACFSGSLNGLKENLVQRVKLRYYQSNSRCHGTLYVKCFSAMVLSLTGLGIFSAQAKVLPYDSPAQYVFDLRVIDRLDRSIPVISLLCEPRSRLFIV